MITNNIKSLLNSIEGAKAGNQFDKYISQAKFPNFKNLAPGTIINFDFPLTVLVGPNGTGKSSILHALWGMPYGKSTSRFWFSTQIDPIKEGGELGNIRYIYTFYARDINEFLSVRKIRTKQKLGYFEPTKPSARDGMPPMPRLTEKHKKYRTDRWTPVQRNVIYINSKCEVGVFERYFYQIEPGKLNEKLKSFAYEAGRLKNIIDNDLKSARPGGHEFVFENKMLEEKTLAIINKVLNQDYLEARYILHRYYDRAKAPSVIFKNNNRTYSDAFAGSGELSVVTTVLKILEAKKHDLILIDEPETSLHPQAQINLIEFILEQLLEKKLQVVISTHSPTIVELLPKKALKVLEIDSNGKSIVLDNVDHYVAFHRIGHIQTNKITLIAEDQLLFEFIKFCLQQLDKAIQNKFDLKIDSVGVDEILKHHIPSWMASNHNLFIIIDGDQQEIINNLPETEDLTESQKNQLKNKLKALSIYPAGLKTNEELIKYIKWTKKRVKMINAECPEQIFLELYGTNEEEKTKPRTNQEFKSALYKHLVSIGHDLDIDAKDMNVLFQAKLIEKKGIENAYVSHMKELLLNIIENG